MRNQTRDVDFSPAFVDATGCFTFPPFAATEATDAFRTPETKHSTALIKCVKCCPTPDHSLLQMKVNEHNPDDSTPTQRQHHLTSGWSSSHCGSSHTSRWPSCEGQTEMRQTRLITGRRNFDLKGTIHKLGDKTVLSHSLLQYVVLQDSF